MKKVSSMMGVRHANDNAVNDNGPTGRDPAGAGAIAA